MSNEPFVCLTRIRDGKVTTTLLIDGKYWIASEWEHELIRKGFSPEELGMFSFTDEDLAQDE